MKVKLINAIDFSILDQFSLNKSLHDKIKYLKSKYDCEIICDNSYVNCYVRCARG